MPAVDGGFVDVREHTCVGGAVFQIGGDLADAVAGEKIVEILRGQAAAMHMGSVGGIPYMARALAP